MSRLLRVLASGVLLLALTACAGEDDPAVTDLYSVTGEIGAVPVVHFDPPLPLSDPQIERVLEGDGTELDDDSTALLSISTFAGSDGSALGPLASPVIVEMSELDGLLAEALPGAAEGSRFVAIQAVDDGYAGSMELVVIDVVPTRYTGEPREIDFAEENLPTIGEDGDGAPTAEVNEGISQPDLLRVVPIARAEGPQVQPGDLVYAQFTIWTWAEGIVHYSTWEDGGQPAATIIDETFPGIRDGLLDQTVGSRVLILIPPDLGIGTDSLIAVVDILAVGRAE